MPRSGFGSLSWLSHAASWLSGPKGPRTQIRGFSKGVIGGTYREIWDYMRVQGFKNGALGPKYHSYYGNLGPNTLLFSVLGPLGLRFRVLSGPRVTLKSSLDPTKAKMPTYSVRFFFHRCIGAGFDSSLGPYAETSDA